MTCGAIIAPLISPLGTPSPDGPITPDSSLGTCP
jgi:hypothetical protein